MSQDIEFQKLFLAREIALRCRWKGHKKEFQEIISLIRTNADGHKSATYISLMDALAPFQRDINDVFKVEKDLRGAPLAGVDLSDSSATKAHLSGADLGRADLSGAKLPGADISGAQLWGANLEGADLSYADLSKSDLSFALLKGANLLRADLSESHLMKADLSGAKFSEANLSGTNLIKVLYTTDELWNQVQKSWAPQIWNRIPLLKNLRKWDPVGITDFFGVDTTRVVGCKNPVLKRHMEDYQFIQGFKEKSLLHRWIFYPLWKATSDCGRSLLLWLLWSVGFVSIFAWAYSHHLSWFQQRNLDWFNTLYFSVVTFTTLGFGDVSPNLTSHTAQGWVMAEVIIGYIMLGGLISILANKLARRA